MAAQEPLRQRLEMAVQCGAHRFDPVRFRYIKSLACRCTRLPEAIGRSLERKAHKALDDYTVRHESALEEARGMVEDSCSQSPEAAERMRRDFEQGDFMAVKQLAQRLRRGSHPSMLADLVERIANGRDGVDIVDDGHSMDELLRRQEAQVLQSITGDATVSDRPGTPLQSFHQFRASLCRLYANTLVDHAIRDSPENPGPLNRQMLATRSLSTMARLSPGYLNRFIAYIDTLLWLQQTQTGPRRR